MPPHPAASVVSTSPPNEVISIADHREGGEPFLYRSKETVAGSHYVLHCHVFHSLLKQAL
jgi:hypothetical protein